MAVFMAHSRCFFVFANLLKFRKVDHFHGLHSFMSWTFHVNCAANEELRFMSVFFSLNMTRNHHAPVLELCLIYIIFKTVAFDLSLAGKDLSHFHWISALLDHFFDFSRIQISLAGRNHSFDASVGSAAIRKHKICDMRPMRPIADISAFLHIWHVATFEE